MAKAVEVFGGSDSGDGKVALDVFDLGVGMPEKIVEQDGQSGFGCVRVKGFAEFTAIAYPN